MARNLPNGSRKFVNVTIGSVQYTAFVKSGTAALLGLKSVAVPPTVKKRKARGWVGTQSYTLLLKKKTSVGGATVATLDFPVSSKVKFADFYKWAKGKGAVGGITTPWGRSYRWDDTAGGGGGSSGGNPLGNLPGDIGGALSTAADFFGNQDGQLDLFDAFEIAKKVL